MKKTRLQMVNEATKRMKALKIMDSVIKDFKDNKVVYYSEGISAILFWVSNKEKFVNIIANFEAQNNALVYHAILTHSSIGTMLSLMYVSANDSEWEYDNADIKHGAVFCYVVNLSDNNLSEFGSIGIKPTNGGVARVY